MTSRVSRQMLMFFYRDEALRQTRHLQAEIQAERDSFRDLLGNA